MSVLKLASVRTSTSLGPEVLSACLRPPVSACYCYKTSLTLVKRKLENPRQGRLVGALLRSRTAELKLRPRGREEGGPLGDTEYPQREGQDAGLERQVGVSSINYHKMHAGRDSRVASVLGEHTNVGDSHETNI